MAKLKRGTTFITGEGPTPAMFNDHLDESLLYGITSACNASGVNLATIQGGASPPGGADGDPYVATDGELKFHDGTDYESVVGTHLSWTLTLQNVSGGNMTAGDVVVLAEDSDDGIDHVSTTAGKVVGALKQNLVDTEWGEVYVRGIAPVRISTAFPLVAAKAPPGTLVMASTSEGVAVVDPNRDQVSGSLPEVAYFAMTLGTVTAVALGPDELVTCYIWK